MEIDKKVRLFEIIDSCVLLGVRDVHLEFFFSFLLFFYCMMQTGWILFCIFWWKWILFWIIAFLIWLWNLGECSVTNCLNVLFRIWKIMYYLLKVSGNKNLLVFQKIMSREYKKNVQILPIDFWELNLWLIDV